MAERHSRDARRREFLRSLVRYPLLAGLGLLGGRLATGRGPLHPDQACTNHGLCRGCGRLAACGLPQAALARPVLEAGGQGPAWPARGRVGKDES